VGAILLLAATAAIPVEAQAPVPRPMVLRLDPAQTQVTFTLGATLHTVDGEAHMKEGEVRFEAPAGAASGRIVIDATSLNTKNERRDRNMHEDVLESAKYKEIVFEPSRLLGTFAESGESDVRLTGKLSIHGGAHDVDLPAHVAVSGGRVTGTGHFSVPYVAWGMKDPSAFVLRVKKEVEIELRFEGALSAQ